MNTDNLRFGDADLSSCDREPIHLPNSIQPHGVLLVVDRQDLSIRHFAGDTHFQLGVEAFRMPQLTLFNLFDDAVLQPIVALLRMPAANVAPSILLGLNSRTGPMPLDATVHALGNFGIIELEPARRNAILSGDPLAQVKSMLSVLQAADSFGACCDVVASQMRATLRFDRVMVYQFLHDGSGKVIAEDKADALEAFLGLHYPASDIPLQARELYKRNWLRLIPDVNYTPTALQPDTSGPLAEPLDMSMCTLRSVSPLHLEYLRNMRVSASMSVSIVIGNVLWGLIACHNHSPRYVAADMRVACELFAQIFSLHLETRIEADAARRRVAPRRVYDALARRLPLSRDIGAELVRGQETILKLIPAGGVAVWLDGRLHTAGVTPPADFIGELVTWLQWQGQSVLDTHQLSAEFLPALPHAGVASGLLAVSLSRQPAQYVMWFRPERVHSVTWAGNPDKPVTVGLHGERLTPRKSFEAWRQAVRQQATPWDTMDRESAHTFRVWLLETVLQQMDLARLEREAAFAHQSLLMAELDHRVKNTLANIQALVRQTKVGAHSLEDFALSLELRIRAMAHAHGLMAATRWKGASVRRLVEEELAPFLAASDRKLRLSGADILLTPKAAMPVSLVVHELTTNAAKYGALSAAAGCINIDWRLDEDSLVLTWKERMGPPVVAPTRKGFGSVVIERSLRHELQGRSTLRFDPDGVACELRIPAQHLLPYSEQEAGHV